MPTSHRALIASCAAAALFAVALLVAPTISAKGPPPLITVCGEVRCVQIKEPSIQKAPLTWALLSGGHSGGKARCRSKTYRVRVSWGDRSGSKDRLFLMVADRGLIATDRGQTRRPRFWKQVFTWRRAALKRAARRAGPGTPLCRLTARSRLFTGTLARPWLYP